MPTTEELWQRGVPGYKQDGRRLQLLKNPALRQAVKDRDGDFCRYCGVAVDWSDRRSPTGATYDHVDPEGPNTLDNLVVCCHKCNITKSKYTLEQCGFRLRDLTPDLTPGVKSELDPGSQVPPTPPSDLLGSVLTNGNGHGDKKRQLQEKAFEVLAFLNDKTGRRYRAVEENLRLIRARLEKATVEDCKGVIARKIREWKGSEREKYLRPATLFNATNFEQYIGEQGT